LGGGLDGVGEGVAGAAFEAGGELEQAIAL